MCQRGSVKRVAGEWEQSRRVERAVTVAGALRPSLHINRRHAKCFPPRCICSNAAVPGSLLAAGTQHLLARCWDTFRTGWCAAGAAVPHPRKPSGRKLIDFGTMTSKLQICFTVNWKYTNHPCNLLIAEMSVSMA